jgi:hypothetical protein
LNTAFVSIGLDYRASAVAPRVFSKRSFWVTCWRFFLDHFIGHGIDVKSGSSAGGLPEAAIESVREGDTDGRFSRGPGNRSTITAEPPPR